MRLRFPGLFSLLSLLAAAASATDASTVQLPAPVADHRLTWGARTLVLPPGEWTAIARKDGSINANGGSGSQIRSTWYSVYAMDTHEGRMRGGMALRLPMASTPVSSWISEVCPGKGWLLRDDFGGNPKLPECLGVSKMRTHLTSDADPFYAQAKQWAAAQKVDTTGSFYLVNYTRMATNDFGMLQVYIPASAFASDEEAIAWARQLRPVMQPFFEGRVKEASLPPLPRKDH